MSITRSIDVAMAMKFRLFIAGITKKSRYFGSVPMLREVAEVLERTLSINEVDAGTQAAEVESGGARPMKARASVVQRCTIETQTEAGGFSTQTKKGRVPKERAATKEINQQVAKQPKKLIALRRPRLRRPKARLSVIKISAVGEVESNIVRTRRAGDEALLLNVKKGADVRELLASFRSKLEGKTTVTTMEPMVTVECRDLDQDATPDQVARAMLEQHQVEVSSSAVLFRRGRDLGTTVAVFPGTVCRWY
uniref:Uncharacterized protein n=1 Tax=Anopheles farauti TaxID=69004 RepID=A0A182QKJ5_9DIPT